MKIRDDLVGVVHVSGVVLTAGDTIPDGVIVGDHLTVEDEADGARKRGGRRSATRAQADE